MTHATRTSGSSPSVLLAALVLGAVVLVPVAAKPSGAADGHPPTTTIERTGSTSRCGWAATGSDSRRWWHRSMRPDVGDKPPACHRDQPTDEADRGRDGADHEPDAHEEDGDDRHDRGRDREGPPDGDTPDGDTPDGDTPDEEEPDRDRLKAEREPPDEDTPDEEEPDRDRLKAEGEPPDEDTPDEEEPDRDPLEAETAEGEEPEPHESASRSEAVSDPVATTAVSETVPAMSAGRTGTLTTTDDVTREVAAAPGAAPNAPPRASSGVPEPNGPAVWGLGAVTGPVSGPVVLPLVVALLVAVVLVVQGCRHQSPVDGSPPSGRRGRRFE